VISVSSSTGTKGKSLNLFLLLRISVKFRAQRNSCGPQRSERQCRALITQSQAPQLITTTLLLPRALFELGEGLAKERALWAMEF
jgi:hypothetical protein